jgi:trigger factor
VLKVVPKDVDDYINKLVEENPSYTKESKVKAVKNDEVTIDFVGYVDKKAFEGGTMKGHKLVLGSGQFIPGFEDQLIGHKAGDDVKVKVTFPETYHAKDLAGKEAIFETKIHEVNKPEKLEINDALGKKYGFEDLIAFKTDVERILKTSSQDEIFDVVKMRLFDKLEKLLSFDVPSSMLDNEFNMIKKQAGNILKSNKEEDDKKTSKKTKSEEIDDEKYKKIALRRVRIGMFISDYAQKQEIKLDNNDLMAAINKQARMFPENKQFIIDYYTKNAQALEALKGSVLEEKSVTHILSKEIEVKDKEYSMKDMEKFLESELDGEI